MLNGRAISRWIDRQVQVVVVLDESFLTEKHFWRMVQAENCIVGTALRE